MRVPEAAPLDYIDQEYAWNEVEDRPAPEEAAEEQASVGEAVAYGDWDALDGDGGDGGDGETWGDGPEDALAALDAALAELEAEQRAEARDAALPRYDGWEHRPTWDRMYQESSMAFICTDRIWWGPQPPRRAGPAIYTHDRRLGELLMRGIDRSRIFAEQRRIKRAG